jgi:hypothetical protein
MLYTTYICVLVCFRMLRRVIRKQVDVSEERITFIFMAENQPNCSTPNIDVISSSETSVDTRTIRSYILGHKLPL